MATQHLVHAIPVEIQPVVRLKFTRASLQSGVSLVQANGPLARNVVERTKALPVQPGFAPTHLIVVDQSEYLSELAARLAAEGIQRQEGPHNFLDLDGIARQVLVATTLIGHSIWRVGGSHTFDHSEPDFPYRTAGYAHRPTQGIEGLLRYADSPDWFSDIQARALRNTCEKLDCYYRDGSWWVDPLSVALGYFWTGLTSQHPELSFLALCMTLEAIASTSQNEITHILAERCAVLVHPPGQDRIDLYKEIKALYGLRSKIVHGRSAPRKGPVNWSTLAITAKKSVVPKQQTRRMLAVTILVLKSVLARSSLLELLRKRRSEEKTTEALNEYFLGLLLRGEA